MATTKSSPAPTPGDTAVKAWTPPASDQEWVVTTIAEAPSWIDRNWAGFDRGPAIALPAGDLYGSGPYHTKPARTGDTIRFVAAKGATPPRFEVIAGDPVVVGGGSRKPPQASQASLEDMLKGGTLSPDELGTDGRAEVAARSPHLKAMVEDGTGAPEPQAVSDLIKTD